MDHTGWLCTSLVTYSQVQRFRGEFDQAIEYCQQALQLVEGLTGEQQIYVRTDIEYELGKIARDRGDWKAAQDHFLIARETFNHEEENILFNTERAWGLLSNLGFVAYQLGDLDTAAQNYQQCFESYQGAGSKGDKTTLLVRMAALEEQRGAYEVAWNYANEALIWSQKLEMVLELAQAKAICERLSRKLLN
jgi:tetratricopeptide (TPR) repeat protein